VVKLVVNRVVRWGGKHLHRRRTLPGRKCLARGVAGPRPISAHLRYRVLALALSVAMTGCASLDTKTGAGGAARSLEFELGYGSGRPVGLPVPAPDVNADTTQAIKEIEARRRAESAARPDQGEPSRRPDLDHDVTQGIQSRGVDRAIGR
jgi:hypothetical protein